MPPGSSPSTVPWPPKIGRTQTVSIFLHGKPPCLARNPGMFRSAQRSSGSQTARAEGVLYGGCLSILVASLGTPYEIKTAGTVLFLEDLAAKPYQIDRMLMQLKLGGYFDQVRGIVFGEMLDCIQSANQPYTLQEVIARIVGDLGVPVAFGVKSGHVTSGNITLPFGVRASLKVSDSKVALRILESAVNGSRGISYMFRERVAFFVINFEINEMNEKKHIHLIGICGTAMASLAGMLKERGFHVTGSDAAAYPPMSDFLRELDIPVAQPFDASNLEPRPDLVVVGNAMSRGNVELEHVLDQRIPFCSLPQLLHDEFLRGREVLVVAGTHGKTTTTSMLAWIFHSAGLDPSFLIGGIAENFGSSFHLGQGKHFILEGDEYDTAFFDKGPKFLHYFPDSIILTSVEFDHADIYKDLDAVETAFKRLVNLIPRRGRIVAFDGAAGEVSESPSLERCLAKAFCPVERYGAGPNGAVESHESSP